MPETLARGYVPRIPLSTESAKQLILQGMLGMLFENFDANLYHIHLTTLILPHLAFVSKTQGTA